jgi:hypothetical protein
MEADMGITTTKSTTMHQLNPTQAHVRAQQFIENNVPKVEIDLP